MGPVEVARWVAGSFLRGGWGIPAVPVAQVPVKQARRAGRRPRGPSERPNAGASRSTSGPIDDPAEMERLLDLGVHGIITDRPQVLKDVLQRRGQWFE